MGKKKKLNKRLLSLFLVMMMIFQYVPAGVMEVSAENNDKLKEELASYSSTFPYGAFGFYHTQATATEGEKDMEVLIVRQGGTAYSATVDVKAVDITSEYGDDYEIYYLEGGKKIYLKESKAIVVEEISKEDVKKENVKKEDAGEDESAVTSNSESNKSSLQNAQSQQTGKEAADSSWRDEYEEYLKYASVVEAADEIINSADGMAATLKFEEGEFVKKIYIHIKDDAKAESGEYVKLLLGNVSVGVLGENLQYNLTIADNEATEKIVFALKEAEVIVKEGAEYAEITIERLSGIDYYAGAVYRTVSKTAESYDAYVPVDGASIMFMPGETEKTVSVALEKTAEKGTYFNVILDKSYVNVEEERGITSVWFGEKKEIEKVSNAQVLQENVEEQITLNGSDANSVVKEETTEKFLSSSEEVAPCAETIDGVVYDVVTPGDLSWLNAYATGLDSWAWRSSKWGSMSGTTKVRVVSTLYGRTDCWLWWAYDKHGDISVGGNVKVSHEYDDGNERTYTDTFDVSYAESKDGTVKIYVDTDGVNDKAGYKITQLQFYYPRYTIELKSSDAKQTLKGKNYTAKDKSTTFDVPAISGNASWTSQTVSKGYGVYLTPGSLTNGVEIEKYQFYVGSTYVGETSGNIIYYSELNKFREKYDSVLRGAKYKLTVKPVYRTKAATVTFESEDASAIAFSGNKAGSTGFKVGETLNCTMIDRVTFTATCPNLQEIKVASVAHLVDTNKRTNQTFKPSSDSEKMSLTKTMDVNYEKEYLKVYFNTPTFEVSYTKDEESASNSNAGAVSIYDYTDLNKMLAVGSVGNPILLSNSDDKLSLLNSTYLLRVIMGEGFDHFELDTPNGKIPFTTRTIWTYRDPSTKQYKSVYGNSFVFSPYYADELVNYHFKAVQDDESPVGVKGTVYIDEVPLFSKVDKQVSTKATGVTVNIGGYQATTGNDGTYSINSYFNKGEYVGAYVSYDTLTMAMGIDISKDSVRDFHIPVDGSETLRVTSSTLMKYMSTNESDMSNNKIYENREVASVLLEDAKYTLELTAESIKAGISPKYAEFYIFDKNGNMKGQFTKRVNFVNGKAVLELNPMNVKTTSGTEETLSVGDSITVKLFDDNDKGYFMHQTSIIIGEKLEGMYTFNYKGAWKQDDDNAFIQALGYLSVGYDFVIDALSNEGGTHTDADGNQHQLMYIGFGNGFSNKGDNAGEEAYKTLQNTIKEIDDINNGDVSVTRQDSISIFGNGSFNLNIGVGVMLDCVMSTDPAHKGEYKFNDYVLIANVAAAYSKEWEVEIPKTGIKVTFGLEFKAGDPAEGKYSGVKWHFYNDSDRDFYIKKNDVIDLLASDYISSKGSIGFQVAITGSVKAVWEDLIGVAGSLQIQVENYTGYDRHNGWSDYGAVLLTPTVKIVVLKIPIPVWTNTWRYDWGTGEEPSSMPYSMNRIFNERDIMYTSTAVAETLDYSYTDNRPAWNPGESAATFMRAATTPKSAESVTEKVLQGGFLSDSDICVQDIGNGKYIAAFLDVVEGRTDVNKMGAYYSLYNGNTWSEPVLLEEDGTSDQLPVIRNAGSQGYLIAWSDSSRTFDEDENFTDRLNSFDLTGRFYDVNTGELSDAMQITKTTTEDNVGDTNPHIAYYKDANGAEHMKVYYTKSEYYVSDENEGEVVGDILNPYQVVAVRNFDFENGKWMEGYAESLEEQIKEGVGEGGYDEYLENWYGQEFLELAPAVEVTEELDEEGYWKEGTSATVTQKDMSEAVIRRGDAIAYNDLALYAYVLDKGGVKPETDDQNLYLQIYNFEDDEYHHPIQLTSKNAEISNVQFMRSTISNGQDSYEVTWLYYLEDGDIKRINVSRLVKGDDNLIEATSQSGAKYYYVNREKTDILGGYEPAQVIAESTEETTSEGETFTSISSFKVKSDESGRYNYVVWSQFVRAEEEDIVKQESQLFVVREDTVTGDTSCPVQVTDKTNQYISGFDYVVTGDGNIEVLAGREMLDEEGQPDNATSELVFMQVKASDKLDISNNTDGEAIVDKDGNLIAKLDVSVKNESFDKLKDVTVEVLDADGNVVYTSDEILTYYDTVESETSDGGVVLEETSYTKKLGKFDIKGGEIHDMTLSIPLKDDYSYEGTIRVTSEGNVIKTEAVSGKLSAELSPSGLDAEVVERDKVKLETTITNDSILDIKEDTKVTYGYVDENGNKVPLGSKILSSLKSYDKTDISVEVDIDFDKFASTTNDDGSLVDSMEFYLDVNNYELATVYSTVELKASAEEVKLMTSLKNLSAQYSLYDEDGSMKLLDELKVGESAYLSLLIGDKVAENTDEYVNGLKVIWDEKSDNVLNVTKDGVVKAVGEGSTTLKGYVVPADTEFILYGNGYSENIDNYMVKPEAMIIPVEVTLNVSKDTDNEHETDKPDNEESTTKPDTEEDTTDKPGGSGNVDNPDTGDKTSSSAWIYIIMMSVVFMMCCHMAKRKEREHE